MLALEPNENLNDEIVVELYQQKKSALSLSNLTVPLNATVIDNDSLSIWKRIRSFFLFSCFGCFRNHEIGEFERVSVKEKEEKSYSSDKYWACITLLHIAEIFKILKSSSFMFNGEDLQYFHW